MSKVKRFLTMNNTKVEYVFQDENGQEYTAEGDPIQEEDIMEKQQLQGAEIEEVMIVEHTSDLEGDEDGGKTNADINTERDPDCKRRDSHHCWGIRQSLQLIETMKQFKRELACAVNRREVWQKIHQDVTNKGLVVSIQECQNKWKNLIRSYKECNKMKNKDNMRFRYYKEMCDYFRGENLIYMDHDYDKTKLQLLPLLPNGGAQAKGPPTVTFPPICFTDRQFMEYTNMKREEYAARQKRHEEEMSIRKLELDIQKKKLEVMKKAAMANLQGTKTVNFGKRQKVATNNDNVQNLEENGKLPIVEHHPDNIQILTNFAF